jgi:hypothetical protein
MRAATLNSRASVQRRWHSRRQLTYNFRNGRFDKWHIQYSLNLNAGFFVTMRVSFFMKCGKEPYRMFTKITHLCYMQKLDIRHTLFP